MYIRFNEIQDVIINHSPLPIFIPYAAHSIHLVGKNAVESSTIVALLFAFIPNQYSLYKANLYIDDINI